MIFQQLAWLVGFSVSKGTFTWMSKKAVRTIDSEWGKE